MPIAGTPDSNAFGWRKKFVSYFFLLWLFSCCFFPPILLDYCGISLIVRCTMQGRLPASRFCTWLRNSSITRVATCITWRWRIASFSCLTRRYFRCKSKRRATAAVRMRMRWNSLWRITKHFGRFPVCPRRPWFVACFFFFFFFWRVFIWFFIFYLF
jgi:hypothetical protein